MKKPHPVIRFNADTEEISVGFEPINFGQFGNRKILRARKNTEEKIFAEEAAYLFQHVRPGIYTKKEEINQAIRHICAFHKTKLESALKRLASRNYIVFLLWQYDQSGEILAMSRSGELTAESHGEWLTEGPMIRRAIKYLIERACGLKWSNTLIEDEDFRLILCETAQICAEELVRFSSLSDAIFAVFPDENSLIIRDHGPDVYELKITNTKYQGLLERTQIDGKNRHHFMSEEGSFTLDQDKEAQDKYLGDAFEKSHGIRYSKAIEILGTLVNPETPNNKNPHDGCFFFKRDVITTVAKNQGIATNIVEKILSGFSIRPSNIAESPAQFWDPKRAYAANKRALFELNHKDGVCFAWSRQMAKEAIYALLQDTIFHKFPTEWWSAELKTPLDKLDNFRGRWFESLTVHRLEDFGFVGKSWDGSIGAASIPDTVGEIDFLGYNAEQKLLVIVECKMTQYSSEPRFWRDDISKYIPEKKYAHKFRKKRDWVIKNLFEVCKAMSAKHGIAVVPEQVATVMLTSHPNAASCFIEDFPCVSLTECLVAMKTEKKWPYAVSATPADFSDQRS